MERGMKKFVVLRHVRILLQAVRRRRSSCARIPDVFLVILLIIECLLSLFPYSGRKGGQTFICSYGHFGLGGVPWNSELPVNPHAIDFVV